MWTSNFLKTNWGFEPIINADKRIRPLENFQEPTGIRTQDFPSCHAVPQPSALSVRRSQLEVEYSHRTLQRSSSWIKHIQELHQRIFGDGRVWFWVKLSSEIYRLSFDPSFDVRGAWVWTHAFKYRKILFFLTASVTIVCKAYPFNAQW